MAPRKPSSVPASPKQVVSEYPLKFLLDQSPDGIVVVEPSGRYVEVNARGCAMFGYTREEMLQLSVTDLVSAEDLARDPIDSVPKDEDGAVLRERHVRCKDGTVLPVEVSVRRLPDGRFIGFLRDISRRRQTEDALRFSRATLDHSPEAVYLIDEDARVFYVNAAACRMLGYSKEELLRMRVFDFSPGYPRGRWKANWDRTREVGSHAVETVHRTKEGRDIPVEVLIDYLSFEGREYHCAFARNISTRQENERALRENELRFRRIFEESPTGIVLINPRYEYEAVNRAFCTMLGYPEKELMALGYEAVTHPEDRAVSAANLRALLAGEQETYRIQKRYLRRTGEVVWAIVSSTLLRDSTGAPTQFLGMIEDITERQRAEEALRMSEQRFQEVAQNVGAFIWEIDAEGMYTYASPVATQLWGYTPEELVGRKHFYDLFPPEEREALMAEILPAYHQGKRYVNVRRPGVRNDGRHIVLERSAGPIVDAKGKFQGYRGVDTDITIQIEAEKKLKASLHEKEVLLKEIHHRVKNNMQVISSLLHLESRNLDDDHSVQVLGESINRIRSMALVHEKLYRSESLAAIDFGEYLSSVVGKLVRSYDREGLTWSVEAESVPFGVDVAIPCGLIVNELVTNAVNHGFPEGRKGRVQVGLRRVPGNGLELTVEDDGVGFPPETDLTTMHSMGMTLVLSLTEQIGGTIEREPSAGTRFVLRFPLGHERS